MRSAIVITILLGFLSAGCVGTGQAIDVADAKRRDNPVVRHGKTAIDSSMLVAINEARSRARKCGSVYMPAAGPVVWNRKMAGAALGHSMDMASHGEAGHTGSDGSTADERLTREGYHWGSVGENVAVGYPSADEVVRAWLSSKGHCMNIMNPGFNEIGSAWAWGIYRGGSSARYWTLVLGAVRGLPGH